MTGKSTDKKQKSCATIEKQATERQSKRVPTQRERDSFTRRARHAMGCSVEALLRLGATICEAKEEWKHGHFLDWVRADLGLKPRLSQLVANVHLRFGAHLEIAKNFEQTELYYLAAPCRKEAAQTLIERVNNGGKLTPEYRRELFPRRQPKKNVVLLHTKAASIERVVSALKAIGPDLRLILIQGWGAVTEKDLQAFFNLDGLPVDRDGSDSYEA